MSFYSNINQNQNIPLYSQTSNDWANVGPEHEYAVNLDVGINEYIFSRTTPNNDFIVSSGLVNDESGIKMVGGIKTKQSKPSVKPLKKVESKKSVVPKQSKPSVKPLKKVESKKSVVLKQSKPSVKPLKKVESKKSVVLKQSKPSVKPLKKVESKKSVVPKQSKPSVKLLKNMEPKKSIKNKINNFIKKVVLY